MGFAYGWVNDDNPTGLTAARSVISCPLYVDVFLEASDFGLTLSNIICALCSYLPHAGSQFLNIFFVRLVLALKRF